MTDLVVTVIRFGFLLLLWFAILSIFNALRKDISGSSSGAVLFKPKTLKQQNEPRALVVIDGPAQGKIVNIAKHPISIGRASVCDLVLDDDFISSKHARITNQAEGYLVEDLGSTNGTWVEGEKLTQPVMIKPGVRIKIGRNTLTIRKVEV